MGNFPWGSRAFGNSARHVKFKSEDGKPILWTLLADADGTRHGTSIDLAERLGNNGL